MAVEAPSQEKILSRKIGDIMTKPVVTVDFEATILDASRLMSERSVGALVVMRDGKAYGMITERDLVRKVLAMGLDSRLTKVSKCTSVPLITMPSGYSVKEAAQKMYVNEIRRLAVVDQQNLVGIVTASDLVRLLMGVLTHETVLLQSIARYHKYGY